MGCTNSTAKAPRANKDQKYITKNASDDWSDDEAPNLLQQTSKIENQHRRRLSVSTVDGGLPKAVLQSQIQKSIEIHKAKQQDTSPCMEAPGCGSPSRRTSITSFQDPAMQLVDRSRNMIKDVTLRMLHDLFPEAEHYAIFGSPARSVQRGFDSKVEVVDGVMPSDKRLQDIGVGFACKKGLKPESPNQDDFFILRVDDWSMYGVFDGHGPYGHDVSAFVHKTLPFLIISDPLFETDLPAALKKAFRKVHHLLEAAAEQPDSMFDCALSGSTGSVVVQRDGKIYVAHVGDSRIVMAQTTNMPGKYKAVSLTQDHKPTIPEEKSRIVARGGEVRRLDGDIPHRVFIRNRLYPGLAMSRALGDLVGSTIGIIPDPDIKVVTLTEKDAFVTVCSDGVWEFISNQEAVDMLGQKGPAHVQDAADMLAYESWRRWVEEEVNVVDDVTSVVFWMK